MLLNRSLSVTKLRLTHAILFVVTACLTGSVQAEEAVQLVESPQISPDGQSLVFALRGDIWHVASQGGAARRLTSHPADDGQARYSPDGKRLAFVSNRTGSRQVFVMDLERLEPKQVTSHTEGYQLMDWFPDGRHLLVIGNRDHEWKYAHRLFKIDSESDSADLLLFDDSANDGKCSPNGKQLLYVTGGEKWWRRGYRGSRAAQIWQYDLNEHSFTKLLQQETESLSPVWKPDGSGFYYCSSEGNARGARNVWEFDLASKQSRQITNFDDDLARDLSISADGGTLLFTHLFDLYRLDLNSGENARPTKLEVTIRQEDKDSDEYRRRLAEASDAAITSDGLEVAFISGGDLWVMETVLREPVRMTKTAEFESDPVFVDDGAALVCVGWNDGQADLLKITRTEPSKYWWQNSQFQFTWLTNDASVETNVLLSPNGKLLAYVREPGELWLYDLSNGSNRRLVKGFDINGFDFSPDSQWITYSNADNDFNSDVWIQKLDESIAPVNITRHPANEVQPKWSSDGSIIAFTGPRNDLEESDIYYVYLQDTEHDTGSRDRKLQKTLDAFKKSREKSEKSKAQPTPSAAAAALEKNTAGKPVDEPGKDAKEEDKSDSKSSKPEEKSSQPPEVKIDFEQIHRRVRQIAIGNSGEQLLGWQPGNKKLLFSATVDGQRGTYAVEFPEELSPKKVSSEVGQLKGWLKSPDKIFWLVGGVPATQTLSGGGGEKFGFTALQTIDLAARNAAAFDASWRTMRDWWYDDRLGNNNWDAIRRKYIGAATQADSDALATVVQLMLGELNGSHLGFTPTGNLGRSFDQGQQWQTITGHLGARYDTEYRGPGWKIKDVIEGSPATDEDSRLHPGEVILAIDGRAVDPSLNPAAVLTGPGDRDVQLRVQGADADKTERSVTIRPTTYARIRSLLYQKWQDDNRRIVSSKTKDDNIGYLHIEGMNWQSFLDFRRELFEVGFGKDGLIIDVRDNGGGSTADHLLTALTQPRHAITVPRGGGPGYPHDRMVYATWFKPIVVLCNQNSFSNAEIFSHAIKTLGRGKLVGVPTAGGVISTGGVQIMDVGFLRLPYRGWFLKNDGQDMELNGAVPDIIVWPQPTEMTSGKDRQLNRAIKALQQEIKQWKSQEQPDLIKATERK